MLHNKTAAMYSQCPDCLARFRVTACVEDINFRAKRGLERGLVLRLASGDWIRAHQVVLLVGPTGTGKTWLACALGQSACRQGHTVRYTRLPRLLGDELGRARADGSYGKLLQQLAKTDLFVVRRCHSVGEDFPALRRKDGRRECGRLRKLHVDRKAAIGHEGPAVWHLELPRPRRWRDDRRRRWFDRRLLKGSGASGQRDRHRQEQDQQDDRQQHGLFF